VCASDTRSSLQTINLCTILLDLHSEMKRCRTFWKILITLRLVSILISHFLGSWIVIAYEVGKLVFTRKNHLESLMSNVSVLEWAIFGEVEMILKDKTFYA
jgi:hypothetical protein